MIRRTTLFSSATRFGNGRFGGLAAAGTTPITMPFGNSDTIAAIKQHPSAFAKAVFSTAASQLKNDGDKLRAVLFPRFLRASSGKDDEDITNNAKKGDGSKKKKDKDAAAGGGKDDKNQATGGGGGGGGDGSSGDGGEAGDAPKIDEGEVVVNKFLHRVTVLVATATLTAIAAWWWSFPSGRHLSWQELYDKASIIEAIEVYTHYAQLSLDNNETAYVGVRPDNVGTEITDSEIRHILGLRGDDADRVQVNFVGTPMGQRFLRFIEVWSFVVPFVFFPLFTLVVSRAAASIVYDNAKFTTAIGNRREQVLSQASEQFQIAKKTLTRFRDIAGMTEAKGEIVEIVDFLKHPDRYTRMGAKIPAGALLLGVPGTGKTLLAKAVAGESDTPFIACCGSDFVELYAGMGALRVRKLFELAKTQKKCIIYIDEIDAIGGKRSGSGMGEASEQEHTLNEMLTQLDGFNKEKDRIIVLASTNAEKEMLDPALIRPGRFDRVINVEAPVLSERVTLFETYIKTLKLLPNGPEEKKAEEKKAEEKKAEEKKAEEKKDGGGEAVAADKPAAAAASTDDAGSDKTVAAAPASGEAEKKVDEEASAGTKPAAESLATTPAAVAESATPAASAAAAAAAAVTEKPAVVADKKEEVEVAEKKSDKMKTEQQQDKDESIGWIDCSIENVQPAAEAERIAAVLDAEDKKTADAAATAAATAAKPVDIKVDVQVDTVTKSIVTTEAKEPVDPAPILTSEQQQQKDGDDDDDKQRNKKFPNPDTPEMRAMISSMAERMSGLCPGFVGADIASVCNEAAILAARERSEMVTILHLERSIDRVLAGIEHRSRMLSDFEKKVVAHHEAGHAVAGWFLGRADPLMKVSIVPRGGKALGYAQYLPNENQMRTRAEIEDSICVTLGGRVAEKIFFDHLSTGASDDLQKVRRMAYMHASSFGRATAVVSPGSSATRYTKPYGTETEKGIDDAAKVLVDKMFQRTMELLTTHKGLMQKLADHLEKKEVLTHADIVGYMGARGPRPSDKANIF